MTLEEINKMVEEANGEYLNLSGCTGITALPEGLTCNYLYMSGCTGITAQHAERRKVKRLCQGDMVPGKYIYCDGILTHLKKIKQVGAYTLYIGKIPGNNVVSDGTNYAHCRKLRDGIADLQFKSAADRGADQYKGIDLDKELTVAECMTMYRIITGACRAGSEAFVKSRRELKDKYTVREIVEQTNGQYGAERFAEFFGL